MTHDWKEVAKEFGWSMSVTHDEAFRNGNYDEIIRRMGEEINILHDVLKEAIDAMESVFVATPDIYMKKCLEALAALRQVIGEGKKK